jgi:hypothetical protein
MPLNAGSRLGSYEVKFTLGVGGMGEVYCARDIKLDRDAAGIPEDAREGQFYSLLRRHGLTDARR